MPKQNKHFDFDAFRKERRKEPPTITMYGKVHELPQDIPAALALSVIRLRREHGDLEEIPSEEMLELGYDLFGKDRLQDWLDHGLSITELEALVIWAIQLYFSDEDDEAVSDAEGNAKGRRKTASKSTSSATSDS